MQAEVSADILDALIDLVPGQTVKLHCQTSSYNPLLKKNTEDGRVRVVPEAIHLREIPYVITGVFRGMQYEAVTAYALIEVMGECAVFGVRDSKYCVVSTRTWLKIQSVPVGAVIAPPILF